MAAIALGVHRLEGFAVTPTCELAFSTGGTEEHTRRDVRSNVRHNRPVNGYGHVLATAGVGLGNTVDVGVVSIVGRVDAVASEANGVASGDGFACGSRFGELCATVETVACVQCYN